MHVGRRLDSLERAQLEWRCQPAVVPVGQQETAPIVIEAEGDAVRASRDVGGEPHDMAGHDGLAGLPGGGGCVAPLWVTIALGYRAPGLVEEMHEDAVRARNMRF